jgi:hypothetical protein
MFETVLHPSLVRPEPKVLPPGEVSSTVKPATCHEIVQLLISIKISGAVAGEQTLRSLLESNDVFNQEVGRLIDSGLSTVELRVQQWYETCDAATILEQVARWSQHSE